VRRKRAVIFPAHEVERFTEHFWGLLQFWRRTERDRLDLSGSRPGEPQLDRKYTPIASPAGAGEEFL